MELSSDPTLLEPQSSSYPTPSAVELASPEDLISEIIQSPEFPTGTGNVSVYVGSESGNVRYIGITNDPERRFLQHLRSGTIRETLDYHVLKDAVGLSRMQARVIEQNLINYYRLNSVNYPIYNKINSIAPRYWNDNGIIFKISIGF